MLLESKLLNQDAIYSSLESCLKPIKKNFLYIYFLFLFYKVGQNIKGSFTGGCLVEDKISFFILFYFILFMVPHFHADFCYETLTT